MLHVYYCCCCCNMHRVPVLGPWEGDNRRTRYVFSPNSLAQHGCKDQTRLTVDLSVLVCGLQRFQCAKQYRWVPGAVKFWAKAPYQAARDSKQTTLDALEAIRKVR